MKTKIGSGLALIAVVLLSATAAYAAPDADAVSAVTAGATTLKDTVIAVGTAVLPFAAAIAALLFGWRMAKRFVG